MKAQYDRRKFLESALKLPFVASVSYAGLGYRLTCAAEIDDTILDGPPGSYLATILLSSVSLPGSWS